MTRIALALGSGAARGCAHIGVINALEQLGVKPDVVCGCSVGALVGAAYAAGNLARLDGWMRALTRRSMLRYFEVGFSGGFIDSTTFNQFLAQEVCDERRQIEDLDIGFAAVATEIRSGREVWLTKGGVLDAVRASIALPGLLRPIAHHDDWLVDGGLVNPVPVALCRALGADVVIAVNLNSDIVGKRFVVRNTTIDQDNASRWWQKMSTYSDSLLGGLFDRSKAPGLIDSLTSSFHIMQDRITSSRLAAEPPDVTISPQLAHIGLLEFHRAGVAINEGQESVMRMARDIERVLAR